MFYKKGDFGDLKGVDNISLLGTENIFCARTWSLGSLADIKSIPGQLNLKTFFMGNYVHTNVYETVSMKWKVIAAYLSGNLQSWEQENKSQKKQNDCCDGNSATSVILFLSWCTFLVPSLKNTAPIFLETFLI